ncbi:hypothetical protein QEL93_002018 [Pseudomonas putida]|nr:hypothetical protein [Pseudomonas putida]
MSVKNSIKGLQKQVRRTEHDATVAAISQLMDELSAAAAGGSGAKTNDLETLFSDLEAEQKTIQKGIEPCN